MMLSSAHFSTLLLSQFFGGNNLQNAIATALGNYDGCNTIAVTAFFHARQLFAQQFMHDVPLTCRTNRQPALVLT